MGWLIVDHFFDGFFSHPWPGLTALINQGVFLLISFSFLASALFVSTRRLRINLLNVISAIALVIVVFYYARVIALSQSTDLQVSPDGKCQYDQTIQTCSYLIFILSVILLYLVLCWESYVVIRGNESLDARDGDYDDLKSQYV